MVDAICISGNQALNEALNDSEIKAQLKGLEPEKIKKELLQCGWNEEALNDHEVNKSCLIWLAAWNIYDNRK